MKQLDEQARKLCSFQAKLFEASHEYSASSSAVFIRRFMRSEYARRLDWGTEVLEAATLQQAICDVEMEYGARAYGSEKYQPMELHWMGYVYRYICVAYDITSKEAYRIIGARELRELYYPYHTLDTALAVERIFEAKGGQSPTDISYGVETLKRIRGIGDK